MYFSGGIFHGVGMRTILMRIFVEKRLNSIKEPEEKIVN
jgi:hypothetical protein